MTSGTGTRDRLIRTTGRLLRTQGYAATGLNQVMAEAAAPKGSMYFHFPGGKAELAAAAIDRFAGRIADRMADDLTTKKSVAVAAAKFFDDYIAHLERTDFLEGCPVAAVAVESGPQHQVLGEAIDCALRSWTDLIAAALEREGRTAVESHGLATVTMTALEGAIVMSKGQRSTKPLATSRDVIRKLLAPPR